MKVTGEMVKIALEGYYAKTTLSNCFHDIKMKAALEAVFEHLREATKKVEEEAPAGDGWIVWKKDDVPIKGLFEIKRANGIKMLILNPDWKHRGMDTDIIAYRIVPEQKEEKTDIEKLINLAHECGIKPGIVYTTTKPEPKKQTLWEYVNQKDESFHRCNPQGIFELISEYLEANNATAR